MVSPMKSVFVIVLLLMAALMVYNTVTHGRRGRWWGGR
jgi:hypothetical protein